MVRRYWLASSRLWARMYAADGYAGEHSSSGGGKGEYGDAVADGAQVLAGK